MILQASTKGEYGVRIMVDLARHYGERPRSLTDISQAETLPLAYLEQLVKLLREAVPPLVISTRGAHGGYRFEPPSRRYYDGRGCARTGRANFADDLCAGRGNDADL